MQNGLNRIECVAALLSLTLIGCQGPCHELERALELPGWKAKGGTLACARELRTVRRLSAPFGSVVKWRSATLDEQAIIFFGLLEALTKSDENAPLHAFQ